MPIQPYSEKQSPAYQLLGECLQSLDPFCFSHSKGRIYERLSGAPLKENLMAAIKKNLRKKKQELLRLYFSVSRICIKFGHTVLIKQYLCGRRLQRNAYRITSRRKGDRLHMVICYDLYGSERISVSQMLFLQFAILISFFACMLVKIQNQDQNYLQRLQRVE